MVPPGLTLDTHEGSGFLAIALVEARDLRPSGFPLILGRSFFLSGYRLFTRCSKPDGGHQRGLYILRSDTDSWLMTLSGSALTRYGYRKCQVTHAMEGSAWRVRVATRRYEADLDLTVDLAAQVDAPPPGSPFKDLLESRRFAGPMPFTFSVEPSGDSVIAVEGVRSHWVPRPVAVTVRTCSFLERRPFDQHAPILANAFLVEDVPYRWKRGVAWPLCAEDADATA